MKYLKFTLIFFVLPIALATIFFLFRSGGKPPRSEMVFIPGGEVIIGSDDLEKFNSYKSKSGQGLQIDIFLESEKPVRKLFIDDFLIDKYEVTNEEYAMFCRAKKHKYPTTWLNGRAPKGRELHPVNNVTWFDASKYCSWVKKRLPKESEWEKAARGPSGRRYPWGDEFDINKANLNVGEALPIGSRPDDRSEYGVYDMAGNVMEWTVSWYRAYPGSKLESEEFGVINRVLKGWSGTDAGHFGFPEIFSRSSARHFYLPFGYGDDIGFRCVSTVIK